MIEGFNLLRAHDVTEINAAKNDAIVPVVKCISAFAFIITYPHYQKFQGPLVIAAEEKIFYMDNINVREMFK